MSLSINLADACIVLKGGIRRLESDQTFVRGALTLKVTKPTLITLIEVWRDSAVILEGKTKAEWRQGMPTEMMGDRDSAYFRSGSGARGTHVSEDRTFLTHKSIVYSNPVASPSQAFAGLDSPSGVEAPPDYDVNGATGTASAGTTSPIATPPASPNLASASLGSASERPRKLRFSWSAMLNSRKSELGSSDADQTPSLKANFLPGTYTYPFSIPIPHDSPTTAKCEGGSVAYHLKACAHRPGTFTLNLSASTDVVVVMCPEPDEHNLIVEKQWERSLRYRFATMGKTFLVGSEVPLDITLLPLMPIKVYLILVTFEEKVIYSVKSSSHTNQDAYRPFQAINFKGSIPDHQPLLPVVKDAAGGITSSPLYEYVASNEPEGDLAAVEQHLTRTHGPWHLTVKMKIPAKLQPSHEYPDSNVKITHRIRLVLRVALGNAEQKLGDRGAFDITMQFPCNIVSELCKNEWSSLALPTYHRSIDAGETLLEGTPPASGLATEEMFRARSNQSQLVAPPQPPPYVEFSTEAVPPT